MKQLKGISMISLVITVLIIAILATVMIPSGIDKINTSKLTSFNENILTLKQEANTYLMQNDEYPVKLDGSGNPVVYSIISNTSLVAEATKKNDQNDTFYIIDLDKIKLDNKDNGVGKAIDDFYILAKTSGNVYYAKGQKIGNITYYTKQNKGDGVIASVPSTAPVPNGAFDGKVNAPKLAAGMTAIKWNGSAWVNADATNAGNDWYDYTLGVNKWANVKLADGSMLVWIPRYTYKIISGEHTSIAGVIDVKFSTGTADDTSDGYRIHPAFYWGGWNIPANALMSRQAGGKEVTGIWIAKFEASPREGATDTSAGDNVITKHVKMSPNLKSWRYINVSKAYTVCKNMQDTSDYTTYGITNDRNVSDVHLMKNSEWGAVAYLSKYALGSKEITINANTNYLTANTDIVANKNQSTTGTEYGIYDISGCGYEYVASYVLNSNSNLTTYGDAIYSESQTKYKDVFPVAVIDGQVNNYDLTNKTYGYAMYETSSTTNGCLGWFGDYTRFPATTQPFFIRGAFISDDTATGPFCFSSYDGSELYSISFRPTIVLP